MRTDAPRKRTEPETVPQVRVAAMKLASRHTVNVNKIRQTCFVELESPAHGHKGRIIDLYEDTPHMVLVPRNFHIEAHEGRPAPEEKWVGPTWTRDPLAKAYGLPPFDGEEVVMRDGEQVDAFRALTAAIGAGREGAFIAPRGWGKRFVAVMAALAAAPGEVLLLSFDTGRTRQWAYRLAEAKLVGPTIHLFDVDPTKDALAFEHMSVAQRCSTVIFDVPPHGAGPMLHALMSKLPARRIVLLDTGRQYDGCDVITRHHCGEPLYVSPSSRRTFAYPQLNLVDTNCSVPDDGKATQRNRLVSELVALEQRATMEKEFLSRAMAVKERTCCIVGERKEHLARMAEAVGATVITSEDRDARAEMIRANGRIAITTQLFNAHMTDCAAKGLVVVAFPHTNADSLAHLLAEGRLATNPVVAVLVDRACPTFAEAAEKMKAVAQRRGYQVSWRRHTPASKP